MTVIRHVSGKYIGGDHFNRKVIPNDLKRGDLVPHIYKKRWSVFEGSVKALSVPAAMC